MKIAENKESMRNSRSRSILIYSLLILFVASISSLTTYFVILNKIKSGSILSFKKSEEPDFPGGRINIKLFFPDPDADGFGLETRNILNEGSDLEKIERVVNELIKGPRTRLISAIPEGAQLINIFLDKDKILYLNFNVALKDNHPCGVDAEYQTIYSLFKSIYTNFPEIKTIKIMLEGYIAKTICGHIDLSVSLDTLLDFGMNGERSKEGKLYQDEISETNSEIKKPLPRDNTIDIPLLRPDDKESGSIEETQIN